MAIFRDYIAAAIIFNLQILPETIVSGLVLLAIVLASAPVTVLAGGVAGAQLLARTVGHLMMKFSPDNATLSSSMDACTQGYVGKSWERLLSPSVEMLWHPKAPSVYQATIGFVAGYGFALQQLYKEEINAGVMPQSMLTTIGIIAGLILLLSILFRVGSGCESIFTAVLGAALGLIVGYLGTIAIGYSSDRRLTNIWGIPLLRDRINNGSAVYICQP
jgi:hypothetical protein